MAADARADAAVVLGAAAWDKRPSPVFQERINHAIALYQSHRVEKLVFTVYAQGRLYDRSASGPALRHQARCPRAIFCLKNTSRDTYQNLINIKPLLREHDIQSVIIVSDPYHLARAAAIADDLGINAQTSGTPTSRYSESRNKNRFLMQESYALFLYYCNHWGERLLEWLKLEPGSAHISSRSNLLAQKRLLR